VVIVAALILVGLSAFLILQPVLAGRSAPLGSSEEEPTEAQHRKRVTLLQLRDAEYEFAMGKLGEEDYQALRKELSAEALEAIRAAEADPSLSAADFPGARDADLEAEISAIRSRLRSGVFCSRCGQPNPAGSRFCAECGSPLQAPQPSSRS
jgi:cytochrome c-type biogenesis protein CcmI